MSKIRRTFNDIHAGIVGSSVRSESANGSHVAERVMSMAKEDLLKGERVVYEDNNVLRNYLYKLGSENDKERSHVHSTGQEINRGPESGCLIITNFRIIFLASAVLGMKPQKQRNQLFRDDDIILNSISSIYKVSKKKRRKLFAESSKLSTVKKLEIHCKDFRIHSFMLITTDSTLIVRNILRFIFPLRPEDAAPFLLQMDDNIGHDSKPFKDDLVVPRFNNDSDWLSLLQRLKVTGYTVVRFNDDYRMAESLPECFVVPTSMASSTTCVSITRKFTNNRCPVWSYTHSNGCSLVRMSCPLLDLEDELQSEIISHVRQSQDSVECDKPIVIDLDAEISSLSEIRASHKALTKICMPSSMKTFWETDAIWCSALESCGWLQIVANCISVSTKVVSAMTSGRGSSIILRESTSTDLTPLVTCLVQLMLDCDSRTLYGLQCLIEREWVVLGHQFSTRYRRILDRDNNSQQQCPVFLLFLDCVHQLLHQFPSAFEFTEIYLTTLWDSLCSGIFRNFLYDDARSAVYRVVRPALRHSPSKLSYRTSWRSSPEKAVVGETFRRTVINHHGASEASTLQPSPSVWDWSLQFTDAEISLFFNPLFVLSDFYSGKEVVRYNSGVMLRGIASKGKGSARVVEGGRGAEDHGSTEWKSFGYAGRERGRDDSLSNNHVRNDAVDRGRKTTGSSSVKESVYDRKMKSTGTTTWYTDTEVNCQNSEISDEVLNDSRCGESVSFNSHRSDVAEYSNESRTNAQSLVTNMSDSGLQEEPNKPHISRTFDNAVNRNRKMTSCDICDKLRSSWQHPTPLVPLNPRSNIPSLVIWSLCYLRWLTPATVISGGGNATEYLFQCLAVDEIMRLERAIAEYEIEDSSRCQDFRSIEKPKLVLSVAASAVDDTGLHGDIDTSSLFFGSHWSGLTSSFPFQSLAHCGEKLPCTGEGSDIDDSMKSRGIMTGN